jgi:allantoicase
VTRPPDDFRVLPDVAGRALGGSVVWCSDDFFGDVHTLINREPARHDPDAFGPRGKIYDGWETRRRRSAGDDAVIVRLAAPAIVRGVSIDTAFFRGNFPQAAAVDGLTLLGYPATADLLAAEWTPLLDWAELQGDTANDRAVRGAERLVTHVRLRIRPDGGVARFRVFGEVVPDPRWLGGRPDLAGALAGGRVTACSNLFYASPANVLAPGRAVVTSDGWETARRRDGGNDWLVARLGVPGLLHSVVIDTSRFVGNAPGEARLSDADTGRELLPRTPLQPDTRHRFRLPPSGEAVGSVRLDIHPDGGIARLRVYGEVAPFARGQLAERWLDLLPSHQVASVRRSDFFS